MHIQSTGVAALALRKEPSSHVVQAAPGSLSQPAHLTLNVVDGDDDAGTARGPALAQPLHAA